MNVSAPGKLVLLGDYAVLDGGSALVAAVKRRAIAERVQEPVVRSSVVQAVHEAAEAQGFLPFDGHVLVDTSGFVDPGGHKLGLGSSAAVAVSAAALITDSVGETVLSIAWAAHRNAANGLGSGVDVAASFFGGVILSRAQPAPVLAMPTELAGLHLSVFYTGESADTRELIQRCMASPQWEAWMRRMRPLAEDGAKAWQQQDADRFLSVVSQYGWAMAGLGEDAGAPVVTPRIEAIMRYAAEGGGAAKASGAGGGDVVVMWSRDPDAGAQVSEKSGASLLDVSLDPCGLRHQRIDA